MLGTGNINLYWKKDWTSLNMILLKFRIFLLLEYICEGTGRHPCKCYVVIRPSDGSWTNLVLSTSYKIVILGSCSTCLFVFKTGALQICLLCSCQNFIFQPNTAIWLSVGGANKVTSSNPCERQYWHSAAAAIVVPDSQIICTLAPNNCQYTIKLDAAIAGLIWIKMVQAPNTFPNYNWPVEMAEIEAWKNKLAKLEDAIASHLKLSLTHWPTHWQG